MQKMRARNRREIIHAEEEEHAGGELNLVPYLDIVTNVVIFLLATTTAVLALANVNVSAPRYTDPAVGATSTPSTDRKEPLNLTVVISYEGFIIGGSGGVMRAPDGTLPTIKCKAPLQNGRCPVFLANRKGPDGETKQGWVDSYDYGGLKKMLAEVKTTYKEERQAILSADHMVPYQVTVNTMDTLRGKMTRDCTGADGCLFDRVILSAGVQ
jgi:biopolymer transport protein ExbD